MARELNIIVKVDKGQAVEGLKEVDGAVQAVTASTANTEKAMKAALAILTAENIRRFVQDIKAAATEFTHAYADQENASKSLTTALQAQGRATPVIIQQYEQLATKFEDTTVFSDELIQSMESLFVQVGNVGPGQMEKALKASTDLSAGLGIDLRTATLLVAKAFEGHMETLGRYGIVLDETKLKADPIATVLEGINQKFGGQAQAQLQTYTGQMAHLSNQMNNAEESIGGVIVRGLTPLLHLFTSLPQPVQTVTVTVLALTAALTPAALSFATLAPAIAVLLPILSTALPAAFSAILPFLGPVGWIAAGVIAVIAIWKNWDRITEIAQAVYTGIKTWLVDRFGQVVGWIGEKVGMVTGFFKDMYDKVVGHSYVPDMVDGVAAQMARLPNVMIPPATMATEGVLAVFRSSTEAVVSTWSGAMDLVRQGLGTMGGTIQGLPANTPGGMTRYDDYNNPYTYVPGVNLPGKVHPNPHPMPMFANGVTGFSGGPAIVGERGPELVHLPRGSSVTPNSKLGGSVTVHVDARESFFDSAAGVQRLANKIERAIVGQRLGYGTGMP